MPSATSRTRKAGPGGRPGRRLWAAAALAPLLLLIAGVASALAAPGTVRLLDQSPTLGQSVEVAAPEGGTFSAEPGAALLRVTPAGETPTDTVAWCVDARRLISEGVDYPVELQTSVDTPELASPRYLEAAWLAGQAGGLIADAADPGREAAAIQLTIWQLTGQAADVPAVTADLALNARVAELRALAAGRRPAGPIALSGPAGGGTAGVPALVTVSGTPGAVVGLEATGGAVVSAASVTLGADGTAQVSVTPSASGQTVVTARAEGAVLRRAAHLPDEEAPQDMIWVSPIEVSAGLTLIVVAAPSAPVAAPVGAPVVAAPVTPPVVAAPPRAALRLAKRAPRRARAGRAIVYRLTVRNVSRTVARGVVIRDRLPRGTFLPRRPARARLLAGVIVWRVGTLRPGARATLRVTLRTVRTRSGRVVNVARASASNARTVRARSVTRVSPVRQRRAAPVVSPAVVG